MPKVGTKVRTSSPGADNLRLSVGHQSAWSKEQITVGVTSLVYYNCVVQLIEL